MPDENNEPQARSVRILTMHGAKGLSGKVVFIPSLKTIRSTSVVVAPSAMRIPISRVRRDTS